MKKMKEFLPLWKLIKEDRWKFILASLFIFVVGIISTFCGYLNGASVEAIAELNIKSAIFYLLIYLLSNILADVILEPVASKMLQRIENKVSRKLSFNTFKKSLELPAYAYEKTSSGEVINRITNDADSLSFCFGKLLELFSSVVGSVVIIIYVFINSWVVALEIIIFLVILFFVIRKYNPLLINIHKERKKEQDKFTSIVNESIRGIREIKTLGVKSNLIFDVGQIIKIILNKSNEEIDVNKKFKMITETLKSMIEVGVFITCVILLYYNQITLTFFIAMTYYVYRFIYLIENVSEFLKTYQRLSVSLERVNEILENRLYKDVKFGNKKISKVKGIIEFKNVTFGYPDEEIILKDFNLKLESSKKIAIVGKSGQGKSTLFNLITRIFEPINGKVLLDNIDIKELTEESLRKNISVIRQEPFVFNRTIFDNFKLVNKDITLEEVRKYTKQAYLDDYIMSLPNKYDTLLGEGGVNLSGGQKQRLSIARTLSRQSKIVLFDEATSALDNVSQEYVKNTIDELSKDHTVIIVAHRLSTIVDADIIYVVDDGKVLTFGSHDELLKKCKVYKELYKTESLNS